MRKVPVDSSKLGELSLLGITPKVQPGGVQKTDAEGTPQWSAEMLCLPKDAIRHELINVTLTSGQEPSVPHGPVHVEGLAAMHWHMGDRSGLAFDAARLLPAGSSAAGSASASKPPNKEV